VPISKRLLDEEEEVLVDLRPHWLFLFAPAATTAVALAAAVAIGAQFARAPVALIWVLVALVALPLCWLGVRLARWLGSSLVVTNRRIVLRQGVFTRDVIQVRLQRIAEVHSRQDLWQRVLFTGRLVIGLVDDERPLVVHDVRRPRALQRVINRQLDHMADEEVEGGRGRPVPAPPVADRWGPEAVTPPRGTPASRPDQAVVRSLSDQLTELDELRRRGLVTEQEFAVKKAELLSRW
jgi:hypothetical protein